MRQHVLALALATSAAGLSQAQAPAALIRAPQPDAIQAYLAPLIENHTLAGAVTLVATRDRVVYLKAVGFRDIAAKAPMATNDMFWIASTSKPMTATALMMLVDEGKVSLDDPVEKYLPEFKGQMVRVKQANGTPASAAQLVPAIHPIRVREILSHTSGLPFRSSLQPGALDLLPLKDAVRSFAAEPLNFQPGTDYSYSNEGLNTAARIIEVVSGIAYEQFIQQRLLDPLGMKDTTFWPNAEQIGRLAKAYKLDATSKELVAVPVSQLTYPLDDRLHRYPMPAGGLFSTAEDVLKFCRMILNGGTSNGKRLISEKSLHEMTSRQNGGLGGGDYGFGWSISKDGFGHGGALNNQMFIDTDKGQIAIFMVQQDGPWGTDEGKSIWPTLARLAKDLNAAKSADAKQPPFVLRDGDRVVLYGDSITAQRLYTRFFEDTVVSRYPQLRISFFNAGVGGDTVNGGYAGDMETRVKRDVAAFHPTVVTIMLGMNDGHYTTDFDNNLKNFETGYRKLIAELRQAVPGVRLVFIRPSPYEEVAHPTAIPGYNAVLLRFGQLLTDLGREENVPVVDFNQPMTATIQRGMQMDRALSGSLLPDRVHPSQAGHWIMAAALAEGLGVDPLVSSVTIDAQAGKAGEQHNTTVSNLLVAPDKVSWTELDGALPLPLELNDPVTQFLLQASDLAAMDREILRVNGLSAPKSNLYVDDRMIGTFSREELSVGVNLALYQTPMEDQAKSIDWAAEDRARVNGARFLLLSQDEKNPPQPQTIEALDRLDTEKIDQEYESAKPKPHRFELVPGEKQQ